MHSRLHYDLRIRLFAEEKCFGPGVAELMHGVEELGSIRAACRRMDMAYSKAWKILNRAEQDLGFRLLEREAGGCGGGKAVLSANGRRFLAQYDAYAARLHAQADAWFDEYFGDSVFDGEDGTAVTATP